MNNELATEEVVLTGAPASPGIAVGKVSFYQRSRPTVSGQSISNEEIDFQLGQFERALTVARQKIRTLLEHQDSDDAADLLQAQIEIINDPDLKKRVEIEITRHNQPADAAIDKVFGVYLDLMETHQTGKVKDKSIDIADVRDRLIKIINNESKRDQIAQDTILIARNLSPREVIEFSERNVRGIIMEQGGTTSHAAILARSMQIPTVVGVQKASTSIGTEEEVILNGTQGEVVVNPTADTRQKYEDIIEQSAVVRSEEQEICERPSQTKDGHPFILRANIEFEEEVKAVQLYNAEGVGLLRTESVYLRRNHFEDEERQQSFYGSILEQTHPHAVTIRLFDAGGDKFVNLGQQEQNPFLGWRGIRMLLDESSLFEQQIRAILRTAVQYPGRIRILVPMISTLEEMLAIEKTINKLKADIEKKHNAALDVELGIMIEVPAAAIQAEHFAPYVDFMSIGTNDLTQYLLAVDRGNERIASLYDQRHPSVWKMIQHVARVGESTGTPVSVCGELAADPPAACCLLGMGVNELSMTPGALPNVKKALCRFTKVELQSLAGQILSSTTVGQVDDLFARFFEIDD